MLVSTVATITREKPAPPHPLRKRLGLLLAVTLALAGSLVPLPAATAAGPPVVTGVAAEVGPPSGGGFVTLHGAGFLGTYVVAFGSVKTRNLHVWSSTEITVRVPPHGTGIVSVRVARPGIASAPSALARYTYATASTPPDLHPAGDALPAPAVSSPVDETQQARVDLSCTSESFCAAVGDLGLSVFDGSSWSAVTPTGPGVERPQVSCADTFCMAYAADGHRWRYLNGVWTDLGALAGQRSLSCIAQDRVCIAQAGGQAHIYRNSAWRDGVSVGTGGVVGASCTPDGCVVTSRDNYFRIYSYITDTWAPERPMFNATALRTSSLTRGIVGDLQCRGRASCISMGQPSSTGTQKYAVFTGRTWSIASTHTTSLGAGRSGTTQLRDCSSANSFCVLGTYGTDGAGLAYRDWVLMDGLHLRFGSVRTASPTRGFDAISCYDAIACWGLAPDGFQPVGDLEPEPGPA